MLRHWFELQFTEGLNWENFGKAWQFDHIVPATYFDYSNEEDLLLCWSFINMRVEKIDPADAMGARIPVMAVRPYFQDLYTKTGLSICRKMLAKIESIEASGTENSSLIEDFINQHKDTLEKIAGLSTEEFAKLNGGMPVEDILLEREILRKFG